MIFAFVSAESKGFDPTAVEQLSNESSDTSDVDEVC